MKEKDFQIGDFIKFCQEIFFTDQDGVETTQDIVYEIGKICALNNIGNVWVNDSEGQEYQITVDEIEPLPLTPEILEKNGFKKYPYKNSYWYCDEMLELFMKIVCIFPIKDRELYSLLSVTTPRLTAGEDDVYIRCDYVHELQQVLRLCKIEKEIVL